MSHADSGPNHASPLDITPALLQTTCTAPKRSVVAAASACTDASSLTSVFTASVSTPCAPMRSAARCERGVVDVGEHDVHARLREPLRQCEPDAAPGPGDDGDASCFELHRSSPRTDCNGARNLTGASGRSGSGPGGRLA